MLLQNYNQDKYEITEYAGGGNVRERLTGKQVASWTNYWTPDKSIHPNTQEEINLIERELKIRILPYKTLSK